jgi:hypothetical protein
MLKEAVNPYHFSTMFCGSNRHNPSKCMKVIRCVAFISDVLLGMSDCVQAQSSVAQNQRHDLQFKPPKAEHPASDRRVIKWRSLCHQQVQKL